MRSLPGRVQRHAYAALRGQDRSDANPPISKSLRMSAHTGQSESSKQPAPTNPHQPDPSEFHNGPLTTDTDPGRVPDIMDAVDILRIRVLEDSPAAGVFVVRIHCRDPPLLGYWQRKAFFYNGQVQQTDTRLEQDGEGLAFVLHALNRSNRLSNAHYWMPFVVGLCLDALLFRYRLPANLHWNGNIQQVMQDDALVLFR